MLEIQSGETVVPGVTVLQLFRGGRPVPDDLGRNRALIASSWRTEGTVEVEQALMTSFADSPNAWSSGDLA